MIRRYFGMAGHFIGSNECCFHLHTHVRGFCVSTVGEYRPLVGGERRMMEIGYQRFFETMVFKLVDGGEDHNGHELVMLPAETRDEADANHEAMVQQYEGCVEHEDCRTNYEAALICRAERVAREKILAERGAKATEHELAGVEGQ
jgi:hypothetical protein